MVKSVRGGEKDAAPKQYKAVVAITVLAEKIPSWAKRGEIRGTF